MNLLKLFAPPPPHLYASRRQFLQRAGSGFGMVALAGLLQQEKLRFLMPVVMRSRRPSVSTSSLTPSPS